MQLKTVRKNVINLTLYSTFFSWVACASSPTFSEDLFVLLPAPQQYAFSGWSNLLPEDITTYTLNGTERIPKWDTKYIKAKQIAKNQSAPLKLSINPDMKTPSEGYKLSITGKEIVITGKDQSGLFYGIKTLEQLIADSKAANSPLPQCQITDFPELSLRAVHWDLKHHIDKKENYYRIIDKLASYKINHVIIEFEDKLRYQRRPKIASPDALSIEEWKKIAEYAYQQHIKISPLIQGIGHASYILKHEKYKHLRDDPKSDWAFNPLLEETYEVQFDLYLDAIEATPYGEYVHVGGDEVYLRERTSRTRTDLQLHWLRKVCDFLHENNRQPMVWDDVPLKDAGLYGCIYYEKSTKVIDSLWQVNRHKLDKIVKEFPQNCIYVRWNYDDPQQHGNLKAMEWFQENNLLLIGSTAVTTRWLMLPRNESNIKPTQEFAEYAKRTGMTGLFCTTWDDDSPHFEFLWRGLTAFADCSWNPAKRTVEQAKSAFRHREFAPEAKDTSFAFIDDLEQLITFWENALLHDADHENWYALRSDWYLTPHFMEKGIIDLPTTESPGTWTQKYGTRLKQAKIEYNRYMRIKEKIAKLGNLTIRNESLLALYKALNELGGFSPKILLTLQDFDNKKAGMQELSKLRTTFEHQYNHWVSLHEKTRLLSKPQNYLLDQNFHIHSANMMKEEEWQFIAEWGFLNKMKEMLKPPKD